MEIIHLKILKKNQSFVKAHNTSNSLQRTNLTFRKGSYQFQKGSLQNVTKCVKDFKKASHSQVSQMRFCRSYSKRHE